MLGGSGPADAGPPLTRCASTVNVVRPVAAPVKNRNDRRVSMVGFFLPSFVLCRQFQSLSPISVDAESVTKFYEFLEFLIKTRFPDASLGYRPLHQFSSLKPRYGL